MTPDERAAVVEVMAAAIHAVEYGEYSATASADHNRYTWPNAHPAAKNVRESVVARLMRFPAEEHDLAVSL